MIRRLVVLVGFLAQLGSAHTAETGSTELGAREVAARTPADLAQQQRDLVEARLWGLDLTEIQRARQLMAGPRGAFSVANISPVEVLGIHARTPAERDRYAELFRLFYRKRDKIDRVTLWGVHDGLSWKNGYPVPDRTNYPLLYDRNCQSKTALEAVLNVPREME